MDFLQSALSGLHQRNAVLDTLAGGLQAGDLGAHLLGNSQTGGVVTGAVDLVAGGQLLQVLAQSGGVVVVAVGVHRHDVVLNAETAHFHIWLRLITRERDYNLYTYFFAK